MVPLPPYFVHSQFDLTMRQARIAEIALMFGVYAYMRGVATPVGYIPPGTVTIPAALTAVSVGYLADMALQATIAPAPVEAATAV